MIIYIEGVDGSGKTTLVNKLTERIEALSDLKKTTLIANANKLIPTHPAKENRITKYQLINELQRMANESKTIYILDRGPISDIIYRTFDEHPPIISMYELLQVLIMLKDSMLIIHCNSNKAYNKMVERGDNNSIAMNRHKELQYLFRQFMPLFHSFSVDMFGTETEISTKINYILAYTWSMVSLKGDLDD